MDRKIKDLPKRLTEVNEILKHLPKKEFHKIPKHVIENIKENRDENYIFQIDKSKKIYEQPLNRDTVVIISYINYTYLVNDKQKLFLEKIYKKNNTENPLISKKI